MKKLIFYYLDLNRSTKRFMLRLTLSISALCALFIMITKTIQAANKTVQAQKITIPQMMSATGTLVKASSSLIPDKYKKGREKVEIAADFVTHSAGVAQNALNFAAHLPSIEAQARILEQRIRCFDKAGTPACSTSEIGCTTEEVCIAKLLQALANLLEPITTELLGQVKRDANGNPVTKIKLDENKKPMLKDGKPQQELQLEQGAMLNLIAILPPGAKRTSYGQRVGSYVIDIEDTIEFIRSLALMLDPDEAKNDPKIPEAVKQSYAEEPIDVDIKDSL